MAKFRFQDLEIWQMAIQIANELFDIAQDLDGKRLYRFAEQLRGAECPCPTISRRAPDLLPTKNSNSF